MHRECIFFSSVVRPDEKPVQHSRWIGTASGAAAATATCTGGKWTRAMQTPVVAAALFSSTGQYNHLWMGHTQIWNAHTALGRQAPRWEKDCPQAKKHLGRHSFKSFNALFIMCGIVHRTTKKSLIHAFSYQKKNAHSWCTNHFSVLVKHTFSLRGKGPCADMLGADATLC